MKLVEILAREMSEWPSAKGTECGFIVQEEDGELYSTKSLPPIKPKGSACWYRSEGDDELCGYFKPDIYATMACDWETAIITRADWEAERARIKGDTKVKPKANKDGWIRHRGWKCPVEAGTLVDVRYRDGDEQTIVATFASSWKHDSASDDIMAWRPHTAEQVIVSDALHDAITNAAPSSENEALQSLLSRKSQFVTDTGVLTDGLRDSEMPAAKYFDGPLQWRDRITEIDLSKKAAEEAHNAAMAALDNERAELVAKLRAEGLALIEEEDKPQEDMVYWRNWRIGDRVVVRKEGLDDAIPGQMLTVDKLDHDDDDQPIGLAWEDGRHSWPLISEGHFACIEWHSRPSR